MESWGQERKLFVHSLKHEKDLEGIAKYKYNNKEATTVPEWYQQPLARAAGKVFVIAWRIASS